MRSVLPEYLLTLAYSWTSSAARAIYHAIFITPLHALYFHGPLLHGYGFWAGTPPEDMCAALMPGTSALFWIHHVDECASVLDRRFHAFVTAFLVVGYVGLLYKLISGVCFYVLVVRPFLARRPLACHNHGRHHLKAKTNEAEEDDGG